MPDKLSIDEIFDQMEKQYMKWMTVKFQCQKCNKEKSLYHSVLLPQKGFGSNKVARICQECYLEMDKEIKNGKNGT